VRWIDGARILADAIRRQLLPWATFDALEGWLADPLR
jgi:hypothetical protein